MNILYLCADPGIAIRGAKGAAVHVRGLLAALGRAGHTVVVAAPEVEPGPWAPREPLAVRALAIAQSETTSRAHQALRAFSHAIDAETAVPGALRRVLVNDDLRTALRRRFEGAPPDVIYERASLYGIAGVQLAGDLGRPLLLEVNAPLALEQTVYRAPGLASLAEQAERWVLARADGVLAVSGAVRDYVVASGADPARVRVVPNGVDATVFHPGLADPGERKRWNLGNGPVLGFVSGLRPWHGVEALGPLLAALAPRHPDLRLVVVGDGPAREPLARDLAERGLADLAVFTGWLPHAEVAALVRHFDVGLVPYGELQHAFYFSPLKLFECMASGVPVVAAAVGQIAEVVGDGETGLLYRPGDLGAFVAACDRLLSDRALRQRLGAAAAAEVHGRYTWDHNAAIVTEIARALGAGGGS